MIRVEADRILHERGLLALLDRYGRPEVTGSYQLDLMTWRDLDIYVVAADWTVDRFFDLGRDLSRAFEPRRMNFRNERIARTPGLPEGLYWGVYLDAGQGQEWKLDIWAMAPAQYDGFRDYCPAILKRLTPATREAIMAIKSVCCTRPGYRKDFHSTDIYTAVLDHGIRTLAEFDAHRAQRGQ